MLQAKDIAEKLLKNRRQAEEEDAKRRAQKLGLPYLYLISSKVPTEIKAMELIKETDAKESLLVPLQLTNKNNLLLGVFDPENKKTTKTIADIKNKFVLKIVIVSMASLEHAWSYYKYVNEAKEITGKIQINEENLKTFAESIKDLPNLAEQIKNLQPNFTSQVLELILAGAISLEASDIHLEPTDTNAQLRLRIDGVLKNAYGNFLHTTYASLITRIKLLSSLKLNIHDQPQDGRFTIDLKDRDIEIRTSVIPSEYGETVVMRLLDPKALKVNLEELGWREDDLEIVKKEIEKPNGLILNTGPTGSGKTTTLYAFLRSVVNPEIKIITIEDPIEYHLDGISQTQVDSDANYTFASGLRSILRQDPDIILVGEIRDKETAEISLNASLTGHLVFSTLHTNDAIGAIPRLIDLNAKPQILGPALSLVIAQRLIRMLCKFCKTEKILEEKTKKEIEEFLKNLPARVNKNLYEKFKIFEPKGCPKCGNSGYKYRTSIFELFLVSDAIEEAIYKNPTEIELRNLAQKEGMVTMQEDGILKALQGLSSIAEIERLTGPVLWLNK